MNAMHDRLMEPHELANLLGEDFCAELRAEALRQRDNPPARNGNGCTKRNGA
jgi:hypothetical protein